MTIWLYCICRNEARLMPYLLRHYAAFVDRMTFYDDQSDDGTREIISGEKKAVLCDWPGSHGIVDDEFLEFANHNWRNAVGHADWVIWIDADEFLYHPDIIKLLQRYMNEGVTLPRVEGFTMVSDRLPSSNGQITGEIKTGFRDDCWSKPAIFRSNIVWTVGRHSIDHSKFAFVPSDKAEIKLLHYRCLGMDYLKERHARNWKRVPDHCRSRSYGVNTSPGFTGHHGVDWFQEISKRGLTEVI